MRLAKASSCRYGIAGGGRHAGSLRSEQQHVERPDVRRTPRARRGRTRARARPAPAEVLADPGAASRSRRARAGARRGAAGRVLAVGEHARPWQSRRSRVDEAPRAAAPCSERSAASSQAMPDARERPLHGARLRDDLDVLGAEPLRPPARRCRRTAGRPRPARRRSCSSASAADAVERRAEPALEDDPLARELRGRTRAGARRRPAPGRAATAFSGAARQAGAAVVADADHGHGARASSTGSASRRRSRSSSAWRMATAIGLPPLRPRATMYGTPELEQRPPWTRRPTRSRPARRSPAPGRAPSSRDQAHDLEQRGRRVADRDDRAVEQPEPVRLAHRLDRAGRVRRLGRRRSRRRRR